MKRDIELERKILFAIEEKYQPGEGYTRGPTIEGYEAVVVIEHCALLCQQGLIKDYKANIGGGGTVHSFSVTNLTAQGYDYLELIRNDKVWEKTKTEIEEKKLPQTLEVIAKIAGSFMGNFMKEYNS